MSLFSSSDTPAVLSDSDTSQVNLGVRFSSSASGTITGIKYYKGANDTGTHTGSLWSSTGTLLATATFTNETASGWQTVTFSNPVSITAGNDLRGELPQQWPLHRHGQLFYHRSCQWPAHGARRQQWRLYLRQRQSVPDQHLRRDQLLGGRGVQPRTAAAATRPRSRQTTPASALPRTPRSQIAASALLANDTDPDGDALTITGASNGVNGTASFNAQNQHRDFHADAGYTGPASFNYAISDGRGGTASASVSLTVNAASATVVSLFSSNPTPSIASVNDPNSVELGLKFQASERTATSRACASTRARRTPAPMSQISGPAPAPCSPPPPSPTRRRAAGSR